MMNPRHRRSPKNLTLNDVLPDWDSGHGIFSQLNSNTTTPWTPSAETASSLDIAYHGQRSGDKFIAPIVYKWLDDNGELTSGGIEKIVSAISAYFYQSWAHLWELYIKEYDPLHTYTMTETNSETENRQLSDDTTRTPNLTNETVVDQDTTDTSTRTPNLTEETENKTYGFNSATAVPESESTTTSTGTETDSGSGTLDTTTTNTETGTETTERTIGEEKTNSATKTRTGNAYRSPAELMSFDRTFWLKGYFQIIFEDLDNFLTLPIYSESEVNTKVW